MKNLNDTQYYMLSEFFKVFADDTRLKILSTLKNNKMCVSDIASSLGMTHSSISHQLKNLRAENLVKVEKSGKEVYYSLMDDHIEKILELGIEHKLEEKKYGEI